MNHYILDGRYKDLFKLFDLDVEIILKKAKLPEDILNHKSIKMYEKDYYQLLTVIGEISKDPELPIKMATTSQIESFSPPIYASYCSKNGEVCIERLSKYKKLIGLIEDNNLKIESVDCYDSLSSWTGKELWIKDKNHKIFDLSINGYCFNENSVDKAIEEIEKYLEFKNMATFEAFREKSCT